MTNQKMQQVEVHRTVTQIRTFEVPADAEDVDSEVYSQVEEFEWSDRHTVEIDWDAYIVPIFEFEEPK